MGRRLAIAVLTCLAAAPAAAQAQSGNGPKSEAAGAGTVQATFTYRKTSSYEARDMRLFITRAEAPALSNDDVGKACKACSPTIPLGAFAGPDEKSLTVRDLDADGEPEVLLDLYTGGAHCCFITVLYRWDGMGYRRSVRQWGDPGYRLGDVGRDGKVEFLSANGSFAYAFCAYVCSYMPLQIWRLENGRFTDVTRSFPDRIAKDLASARSAYERARKRSSYRPFVKGILPAICADLALLGRAKECDAVLARALRRGELGADQVDLGPSGRKYVADVKAFLRRGGYLPAR